MTEVLGLDILKKKIDDKPAAIPASFVADWYLAANSDVREAIEQGLFSSAEDHYLAFGLREGRPANIIEFLRKSGRIEAGGMTLDSCIVSDSGFVVLMGWVNSELPPDSIAFISSGKATLYLDAGSMRTYRRRDVETTFPSLDPSKEYGLFVFIDTAINSGIFSDEISLDLPIAGKLRSAKTKVTRSSDRGLLTTFLGFVNQKEKHGSYWGGQYDFLRDESAETARKLFQKSINLKHNKVTMRCYGKAGRVDFSHIMVLYKKCDMLALQCALFSECALGTSISSELVIGVNGSEIADEVFEIVKIARMKSSLVIKVVVIQSNVGFGEANNICARYVDAPIILITNPDVFPRDNVLYQHINDCIADAKPKDILGGWLYYGDGSVMHVGMSFLYDQEIDRTGNDISLPRVVHDYKGYSEEMLLDLVGYAPRRSVQAITGAWIVIATAAFNDIGGFSNDFIFGHYEDAEFCVRARSKGYDCVVDNRMKLWHLEGKGSESSSPMAIGAQLVNRITFAEKLAFSANMQAK